MNRRATFMMRGKRPKEKPPSATQNTRDGYGNRTNIEAIEEKINFGATPLDGIANTRAECMEEPDFLKDQIGAIEARKQRESIGSEERMTLAQK